jgi:hypothetical protein
MKRMIHESWMIGVVAMMAGALVASVARAQVLPEPPAKVQPPGATPAAPAGPGTAAAPEAPQDITARPVNLRPMFVKGRTSRYSLWQQREQQVTMEMAGQQRQASTVMTMEGEVTWTVSDVRPDGSATCVMTNDHLVAVIIGADGKRQVCDTAKPSGDNQNMYRFLKSLTGVPIAVEMTAEGKAVGVHGQEVVKQRLGQDLAAMTPADEDFLEDASDLAVLPLAPAELMLGGQWKADFDWSHEVGRMRMKVQCQLANIELIAGIPIATINEISSPVIVPDYSKLPPNAPKINIQQTLGSYQSQVLFDLQRHDVAGSNTVRETGLRITVTLPNNQSLLRLVNEKVQTQLLRIAEQ